MQRREFLVVPIEFDRGSRNQYSGEGFSYLQSVVEEVTHKSFVDFMHDDVLTPLGMTASRVTHEKGTAMRADWPGATIRTANALPTSRRVAQSLPDPRVT